MNTLSRKNIFRVSDEFPSKLARELRRYVYSVELQERYERGYNIVQFWYDSNPLLTYVVDFVQRSFEELSMLNFQQGWFFVYDSKCDGVNVHADPSSLNVNIWLTLNSSIEDWNKNGLIIYDVKHPESWSFEDYNEDTPKIEKFLKEKNAQEFTIPYNYRRMTLFDSKYFHKTNGVHTKMGDRNKRINMTLLFS